MEAIMTSVQPFLDWLLQTTLIGSVVIFLILAAQKVLGDKLGPRWCHALWFVLLIRLVLPGAILSQFSLFNLIPHGNIQIQQQQPSVSSNQKEISQYSLVSDQNETKSAQEQDSEVLTQKDKTPKTGTVVNPKTKPWVISLQRVLPFIWLAGAVVIGLYLLLSNYFLWRIVKRERPLLDQKTLELFEECKEQMGVQTLVGLIPSGQIKSPALFGFIRPRLLLPSAMIEEASQEEMQYIFLHELAHLKRHDIYLGWLTSLLQIIHWFNPLVWFAFYRMRSDRELSCDALVLSRTGKEKSQDYGQAIVGLIRRFSRSRPLPAMAGILENKSQLKRRITMIAHFKKNSYRWSPLAILLIFAFGFVSFSFTVWSKDQNTYLPKSEPNISLRRVETGPMSDFSGPPSLDGRYLCDAVSGHLVIHDLISGEVRQLTKVSNENAGNPVISPESTHVAYTDRGMLQLIKMDGTEQRTLHRLKKDTRIKIHGWTPNGKQILGVFWNGKENQLVAFSIEDGSMQVIHTFETSLGGRMEISPDGRYIAYDMEQKKETEARDIFILDIELNKSECVVQHAANDRLLGWTPDNNYLFFASDRRQDLPGGFSNNDTWDAYVLPVSEGVRKSPPELVKRDIPSKIRPKGFTQDGAFYYAVEFRTIEAAFAEVDMLTGKLLTKPQAVDQTGSEFLPAWSPDGLHLAYCVNKSDESAVIRIRNMDTGQERELDPDLPRFNSLRWSPDGKYFLVSIFESVYNQKFPQFIYKIDASTGERMVLVQSDSVTLGIAQLSLDGRTLFYVLQHPKTQNASLMARDMESADEKELFSMDGANFAWSINFALSPDSQQLALATFKINRSTGETEKRILTMPTNGGDPKELLKTNPKSAQLPTIAWTPDGKFLLFTDPISKKVNTTNAIFLIPADGGQVRELCRPQTMIHGVLWSVLDVHPDGKRIAFDCFEYRHEVWAMGNFLPTSAASKNK